MTGLLDGRGGMLDNTTGGCWVLPAPSIERPSVEHTAGRGEARPEKDCRQSLRVPAGGRSVIEALERARRDWQQQLDLYPDALGAGHPTSVPPDSDPTPGLARAEGAVQEADDGTAPS